MLLQQRILSLEGAIIVKRIVLAVVLCALSLMPAMAGDGLDLFLSDLNIRARTDMNDFSATVSAQFGVPETQVRVVLGTVSEPADAFMVFQLGLMSRHPYERVLQVYQGQKRKGWGVIAQELGIKPGSPEFHALKRGDFHYGAGPSDKAERGKGKDKEKHNKQGCLCRTAGSGMRGQILRAVKPEGQEGEGLQDQSRDAAQ